MRHPLRNLFALAGTLALGAPALAAAQTQVIDEGSFRLSVRGTPVGTETFSIRRSGSGAGTTIIASGRIALDSGEQTRAALQVEGPALRPSAYQIEVTGGDVQSYRGQAAGNRFRATIKSSAGESMREYLASEGAVVIDDGVAHQHYFLVDRAGQGGTVAVIIPRQSRQISATVRAAGTESVDIGGRTIQARRFEIAPSGMASRTLWVDSEGRVLRLAIPDEGFLAERTAPPG